MTKTVMVKMSCELGTFKYNFDSNSNFIHNQHMEKEFFLHLKTKKLSEFSHFLSEIFDTQITYTESGRAKFELFDQAFYVEESKRKTDLDFEFQVTDIAELEDLKKKYSFYCILLNDAKTWHFFLSSGDPICGFIIRVQIDHTGDK